MAHETVFFSKDPDVKPGLVEAIRNQALARSKEQSVGDLAAVMREAVLWTERGRNVSDEDLTAMLEGREDLSEVQENPFAEMMKADDAAEGTAPTEGTVAATENAPAAEPVAEQAAEWIAAPTARDDVSEDAAAPIEDAAPVAEEAPVEETISQTEEPQPTDGSNGEPNMSDEEFEAFMKKAQAFYDTQASDNGESENSDSDDDEFPDIEVHSGD